MRILDPDHDFPIQGYYLLDLNFDNIPRTAFYTIQGFDGRILLRTTILMVPE